MLQGEAERAAGVRGTRGPLPFSFSCRVFSAKANRNLFIMLHSVLHGLRTLFFSQAVLLTHTGSVQSEDGNSCSPTSKSHHLTALGRELCPTLSRTGLSPSTHPQLPCSCLVRLQVLMIWVWLCALLQFWFNIT
jgi:hypothetical protein